MPRRGAPRDRAKIGRVTLFVGTGLEARYRFDLSGVGRFSFYSSSLPGLRLLDHLLDFISDGLGYMNQGKVVLLVVEGISSILMTFVGS